MRARAHTWPEGEVTGVAAAELSSEEGGRVSATVPASDSTAPAGFQGSGRGQSVYMPLPGVQGVSGPRN